MNTHSLFEIKLCLLCRNLVPPFLINTRFVCCWNEQSTFYIGRSFPQLLGAQQTSIQYCIQTFSHRLNGMDILKIRPASSPNSLKSIKISLENIFILSICKLFLFSHFSRIRTEYGAILRISPYSVRMRKERKKRNSLQILKIKIFSRDKKILPKMHQILIIFGTSAPPPPTITTTSIHHRGFLGITETIHSETLKEQYARKSSACGSGHID